MPRPYTYETFAQSEEAIERLSTVITNMRAALARSRALVLKIDLDLAKRKKS